LASSGGAAAAASSGAAGKTERGENDAYAAVCERDNSVIVIPVIKQFIYSRGCQSRPSAASSTAASSAASTAASAVNK